MTIEQVSSEPAEKSLREELQSAFDAARTPEADASPATAAPATGAETATEVAANAARARDERGRFAGKTEATDAVIVVPAGANIAAPAPAAPSSTATPATQPAATELAPPPNLKPELRAAWEAAPPELRRHILEREAEVHKGFTRMDEERTFGKSIRDVITPYAAMIQAEGGTPAGAVQALLNTAYVLRSGTPEQKVAALQQVAQQYRIPLDQVAQFRQQEQVHPMVAQLQQQVQQLTQAQQQQHAMREQQEQAEIHSTIATFAAQAGHEHFDQVKPHMAALLNAGLATSMQDAYEQAVWARPDLRQTVLAAQQQTAAQEVAKQAQARAEAATRAAGSVHGAPGAVVPVAPPDRSLRDELRANFRAAAH